MIQTKSWCINTSSLISSNSSWYILLHRGTVFSKYWHWITWTKLKFNNKFEKTYEEHFGRAIDGLQIEVVGWSVKVTSPRPETESSSAQKKNHTTSFENDEKRSQKSSLGAKRSSGLRI